MSSEMVETVVVPGPPPPAGSGGLPVPVPSVAHGALATVARAAAEKLEAETPHLVAHLVEMRELTVTALMDTSETGVRIAQGLQLVANGDLGGAAELVRGELVPGLAGALGALLDGAAPELGGQLDRLDEVMGAGGGVVGLAAALAPPLEWAHGIVETISTLLEAMALGL